METTYTLDFVNPLWAHNGHLMYSLGQFHRFESFKAAMRTLT